MTYAALGNYSLAGTMLASIGAILFAIRAGKSDRPSTLRTARRLVHVTTLLLTVSSAILLAAILGNDFSLDYVAGHSEKALPIAYKIAAFWAGHEGSLLLWVWLTAVVASITVLTMRKDPKTTQAATMGLLAGISWFFTLILLFAANPFTLAAVVLPDGLGLNPMLQNPAMILHPLLLFIGYAGLAAPFALYLGNLAAGRQGNKWIDPIRKWNLLSWLFLTAGIVLGAWWAYVELGWGGYWAWDPVENASLLPWLTSTAVMHSLISQRRRGTLKVWNAILVPLSLLLCIFGTFLTRTGVVASVHAFSETGVGSMFIAMMVVIVEIALGIIIWRRCFLKSDRPMTRVISVDGGFTAACGLLVVIMLTTLVGTIYPLIIKFFTDTPEMLGPEFYNKVVVPMSLLLVGLMGAAPLLRFAGTPRGIGRKLILPLIVTHAVVIVAAILTHSEDWFAGSALNRELNLRKLWTVMSAGIVAFVFICIGQDMVLTATARWRNGTSGIFTATARSVRDNMRRYGGQMAHLGMAMIVVGVAGSSMYGTEKDMTLSPGQSDSLGKYTVRYDAFENSNHANYVAQKAVITVTRPNGEELVLYPQKRRYFKPPTRNTTSEVAIHSNLSEDIYLILNNWWHAEDDELGTTEIRIKLKAITKPLLVWIWIGGIALAVGASVCLLFGRSKSPAVANTDE